MSSITKFIEEKDYDLQWGAIQLALLLLNIIAEHYLDEHGWSNNIQTGFAYQ
jgi:hypothetical protein